MSASPFLIHGLTASNGLKNYHVHKTQATTPEIGVGARLWPGLLLPRFTVPPQLAVPPVVFALQFVVPPQFAVPPVVVDP